MIERQDLVEPHSSTASEGFLLLGDTIPASPVVLSVPHAGRNYPPELIAALRLPVAALTALEDRHVDAIAHAARRRETMLIQRRGRAWIDLNRGEEERDPAVDEGADRSSPAIRSTKLRSGLGLVPRRAGRVGELWRRRFTKTEVDRRIAADHRPYHQALSAALTKARDRFGIAVLLDIHSMPPLTDSDARWVLGDRFGRSASSRIVGCAEAVLRTDGARVALNSPYAGGHILSRHGRPAANIHALQLEIDRSLYLDARLDRPAEGLPRVAALVARITEALADEALAASHSQRLAAQ